jgi:nitrate reductase alpha subunit
MSESAEKGTYRGVDDIYRDNWKWDKVAWASHCGKSQRLCFPRLKRACRT